MTPRAGHRVGGLRMHRLHIVIHPTDLETFTDAAFALAQKRIPGIARGQVVARWYSVTPPWDANARFLDIPRGPEGARSPRKRSATKTLDKLDVIWYSQRIGGNMAYSIIKEVRRDGLLREQYEPTALSTK